ncbi:DUF6086 family protein [Streptomyces sp. NPDC051771]|uniref:DUF6086 family protein n=1 Tax=Streptomyces sp. NPDC051771 TaxID=3154847 RepID=UPI00342613B8
MSYPFRSTVTSRIVWDPGIGVGRAFAALAAEMGALLEVPTGLTYVDRLGGSDVDIAVFQGFTQKLYDSHFNTNNFVLHGLLRGLLLTSLVMLENGGGSIVRSPESEGGELDEHDAYVRAMWTD